MEIKGKALCELFIEAAGVAIEDGLPAMEIDGTAFIVIPQLDEQETLRKGKPIYSSIDFYPATHHEKNVTLIRDDLDNKVYKVESISVCRPQTDEAHVRTWSKTDYGKFSAPQDMVEKGLQLP
jgi:hypothetical protein